MPPVQMSSPPPPRLLDRLRAALRARHYSLRTEQSYVAWVKRFIFFQGKRHPDELGEPEINAFLSSLATDGKVAASTQNQALSALLFLYRHVLDRPFPEMPSLVPLCANVGETAYPREISEQGGEGIRDNHGRSRGVWGCQGSGRGAAQRA